MVDALLAKENIIHVGAALYLAGFLFRDQIMLRALIIIGDAVYILYFFFAPASPLWGGVFWSAVFITVNLVMIMRIVSDRAAFGMNEEEKLLARFFDNLTPGEFRRLMRAGKWHYAEAPVVITREKEPLDRLYFVIAGGITVEKEGRRLTVPPKTFIGEIAFLLARPATATVTLDEGARYVAWDTNVLGRLFLRAPSLRIAIGAALNRDLADKVARA